MKICLISPKSNFLSKNPRFAAFWSSNDLIRSYKQNWSGISQALLILAAITPEEHDVSLIDENVEEIDFSRNFDLIGITAMTQQANRCYEIADAFRERGNTVVIGGIHATCLPNEALSHADAVVVGEAENIWNDLLLDFQKKQLKTFYKSEQLVDLTKVPGAKYELLVKKNYRILWTQSTRGCPHDCEFCSASNVYGKRFRHKNSYQIATEIEKIQQLFGDVTIGFSDDNFFVNRDSALRIMETLVEKKIRYYVQSDISIGEDDELLNLLKKSGCVNVFIGFESLEEDNLKEINSSKWKLKRLRKYSECIQNIQFHGIGVMGAFIVGFDNDNCETFDKISDFVIMNNIYEAQISILTPLPGTRLRERLEKEKRILPTGWDNYTLFDVNFIHPTLSKEQLENGLFETYNKIHSKDVYLKKMEYFKQIQKDLIKRGLS